MEEDMEVCEAAGANISISHNKERLLLGNDPRADD